MCGIAGIVDPRISKSEAESKIKRMISFLSHRGPDSSGYYSYTNSNLYIGHSRLSIIDLSDLLRF